MTPIENRKDDHLRLCLDSDVQSMRRAGFEDWRFVHQALPEIDFAEVTTETTFLGHSLAAPILISSMTGGSSLAGTVNRNLAIAAQHLGLAMGLGSQRIQLEAPATTPSFAVREVAPDILLIGNVGAVQLNYGVDAAACRKLLEMVGANALYLHLNPLQEAIQPEGNTNFKDLLPRIASLCHELGLPVLVKEVGNGLASDTARRLVEAGVSAIDVAGSGGTSWARIEGHRSQSAIGELFADWGLTTVEALRDCRAALPQTPLVASGGIRSGVDVAKAIAMGADLVGMAMPLLEAATVSSERVIEVLQLHLHELRVAMFCLGCRNFDDLRRTERLRFGGRA